MLEIVNPTKYMIIVKRTKIIFRKAISNLIPTFLHFIKILIII